MQVHGGVDTGCISFVDRTVTLRDGSTIDYYHGRGRLNVAKVAEALGVKPTEIVEVRKGDTVHRVAMIVGWA